MALVDINYEGEGKMGFPGQIIETDECKIGKRKYNHGCMIEETGLSG